MNLSRTIPRWLSSAAKLFLLTVILTAAIQAQSNGVDPSFNAVISKDVGSGVGTFTLQPDGKILVYGNFQVVSGAVKNQIARFNADGSLDNSFSFPLNNFYITSAVVYPNQKIVVAGYVQSSLTDTSIAKVLRLNADGSLDDSLSSPFGDPIPTSSSSASVLTVQPDGKILVSVGVSSGGYRSLDIRRLNPNGTIDNSFVGIDFGGGRTLSTRISKTVVLPDGKILIAYNGIGGIPAGVLQRYNPDGTRDTSFEAPSFTGTAGGSFGSLLNDFKVSSDGSIAVVGNFNSVNGVSRANVAKLLLAGNVDLNFAPASVFLNNEPGAEVGIFSNGKILVRTGITNAAGLFGTTNRFILFNASGGADNSFVSPSNLVLANQFTIDSADNVLLYGSFTENGGTVNKFARLNSNGNVVSSFAVNYGIGGTVSALAIQSSGKVIIAGVFTAVNGISRNNIARLNADGSLDQTFAPGKGFDGAAETTVIQSDGKILVGGSFTGYNGTTENGLARLNSDGSLDSSFNPNIATTPSSTVRSIAVQSNGKILISGEFTSVNGQTRSGIARLNADGSLDTGFTPQFGTAQIRRVLVQSDGKIVVGGNFNGVNGFNRANLVRLNADGTLDATFNAGNISGVSLVELQADGKYLAYGNSFVRLNADGTADQTFTLNGISGSINAISVLADGSAIIGGNFVALGNNLRSNLARLRLDGSVDNGFFPVGANNAVRAIVSQSDGRVIIGGDFTSIAGTTRLTAARLTVGQISGRVTPFDFDGDGRADIAVFRPSNGYWYQLRSQNNSFYSMQFGAVGDQIAPADYDGDGKTDVVVFRGTVAGAGNFAYFYITSSLDNTFRPVQFGSTGDVPVSGDWDGDGRADLAVYRNGSLTGGQSYFFYRPSSQPGADFRSIAWGGSGDKPVVGDFDGDGKLDAAVFRPSNEIWYVLRSSNNQLLQISFGLGTDIPVPADYNGDSVTDLAVFRPSNGFWYVARSASNAAQNFDSTQFGVQGDLPVPADYDGDGKVDIAVYRPQSGAWYLLRSTQGFTGVGFGIGEDKPIPNAYIR